MGLKEVREAKKTEMLKSFKKYPVLWPIFGLLAIAPLPLILPALWVMRSWEYVKAKFKRRK